MNRSISGTACILAAISVLVLPLQWVVAVLIAATIHELCHYLAVIAVGGQVHFLKIGSKGTVMEIGCLTQYQELICAIAGPAGSMMLFALYPLFPRTALCALVQGCYNLLPVYPLDGGRVLRCIVNILFPPHVAEYICNTVKWIVGLTVFICGIVGTFRYHLGIIPILAGGVLLGKILSGKIPCIADKLAVQ